MRYGRWNGGVEGILNTPSFSSANGEWREDEHGLYKRANMFPSTLGWPAAYFGAALAAWYDMSLGSGIGYTGSGTSVSDILDQSGNARDLIAGSAIGVETTINSLDAISNNSKTHSNFTGPGGSDFTACFVANISSGATSYIWQSSVGSTFYVAPGASVFMQITRDGVDNELQLVSDTGGALGTPSVYVFRKSGSTGEARTAGTSRLTNTGLTAFTPNTSQTMLSSATGTFGEILLLSGTTVTSDVEKAEGYLAHKWGLAASLPSGHPYKSAPP